MNTGFVQIPRSLLNHPVVRKAPAEQFKVLITLIENCRFTSELFNDHGLIFEVKPGEFCTTYDDLALLANVDRNHAVRAIKRFSLVEKVTCDKEIFETQILTYEVKRKKTLIKITHKDTYDLILNQSEMISEIKVKRSRNESEMQKNKGNKGNKDLSNDKSIERKKIKKEKIVPIELEAQAVNQDFSQESNQDTSDNIRYNPENESLNIQNESKNEKEVNKYILRCGDVQTTEEEHVDLINYIKSKGYLPGEEEELLKASYKTLDEWFKKPGNTKQNKYTIVDRMKNWAIQATAIKMLQDKEIQKKQHFLNQKKENGKESLVDKSISRFKHGAFYNYAECFITENSIAFQRGATHHEVKFKDFGFEEQLSSILRKFGISEEQIKSPKFQ